MGHSGQPGVPLAKLQPPPNLALCLLGPGPLSLFQVFNVLIELFPGLKEIRQPRKRKLSQIYVDPAGGVEPFELSVCQGVRLDVLEAGNPAQIQHHAGAV